MTAGIYTDAFAICDRALKERDDAARDITAQGAEFLRSRSILSSLPDWAKEKAKAIVGTTPEHLKDFRCYVATSTWVALALAAAAAGASYYNTTRTARRQDQAAAAGIRRQSARQREADANVDKLIDKQAGSSSADEQAGLLDRFMQQLRASKGSATAGISQGGKISDAARAAEADAALGVGDYGTKRAGMVAAMDAPALSRQNEALSRAQTAVDLEQIGRFAGGDAFINNMRLQGIRRNPWLDAFSAFAGGASSGMASGGWGGSSPGASSGSGFGIGRASGTGPY